MGISIKKIAQKTILCFVFIQGCLAETPVHPAAIASAAKQATNAGMAIFKQGGNAFDAAVAVAAVLAVVEPYSSGIGGGGYWLTHHAGTNTTFVIDSREVAPKKATANMFLDQAGEPVPGASFDGALSAAIPGAPAAMVYLAKNYGVLPLSITLAPAIYYAKEGFTVDAQYQKIAEQNLVRLQASPDLAKLFLENNEVPKIGYRIVQPDLANTLEILGTKGHTGFYQGALATRLVTGVKKAGGIWQLSDLSDYTIQIEKPLIGKYHDITITTVPLSSGGGITLINMLNILSGFDLTQLDAGQQLQVIVEVMRRAYFDRVKYLGDNEKTKALTKKLMSPEHADTWRKTIDLKQATPSKNLSTSSPVVDINTDGNTTHFSVLDQAGNYIAATLSLNYYFGSTFMPAETGVLLNNHMDDFSMKPGVPNVYGVVGSQANTMEPGKRPLSSIAPTFLNKKNKLAIIGTPGGSRIPSMLLLAILDFEQGHDVQSWVQVPRYHHQYLPDEVQFELEGLTKEQQKHLQEKGYVLQSVDRKYGDMQAILWDQLSNKVIAASDPRGNGKASVQSD
jgi:gamma-glutamyltranspeptidase / glutathione hydrolase